MRAFKPIVVIDYNDPVITPCLASALVSVIYSPHYHRDCFVLLVYKHAYNRPGNKTNINNSPLPPYLEFIESRLKWFGFNNPQTDFLAAIRKQIQILQ